MVITSNWINVSSKLEVEQRPMNPLYHFRLFCIPVMHTQMKEMRSKLEWTISYRSLYFVTEASIKLIPLFTGIQQRPILILAIWWYIYLLSITFNYFITLTSFNLWREITIQNCYWNDVKWRLRCKVYYTTQTQNYRVQWHFNIFLKKLNPYHGIKKKRPALNIEDNIELLQHCKQ